MKLKKRLFIILVGILSFSLLYYANMGGDKRDELLRKCSRFTVAQIITVNGSGRYVSIEYIYSINNKETHYVKSVSPTNTHDWWTIDQNKLRNRRLMVRVSCSEITENTILWGINIPDTLKHIPVNGWERIPYGLER